MALFRNENPNLGPATTLQELSGFGSGTPLVSNFKPTTREIIQINQPLTASSATSGWVFVAPWTCLVLSIKVVYTAAGGAAAALAMVNFIQSGQPQAPSTAANGTTVIALQSANLSLTGTANTVFPASLSSASGSPLIMHAGDAMAYQLSGTLTGLAGGVVQVELAQIG